MQEIVTVNAMEQIFERILTVLPRYSERFQAFNIFKAHDTYNVSSGVYNDVNNTILLNLATPITDVGTLALIFNCITTGITIKNNISQIEWVDAYSIKVKFNSNIWRKKTETGDNILSIGTMTLKGVSNTALNTNFILHKQGDLIDSKTIILTLKDISYNTNIAEFPTIINSGYVENEYDFDFNGLQKLGRQITANTFQYTKTHSPITGYIIDFTNAKLLVAKRYHTHSMPYTLTNLIIGDSVTFQLLPSDNFLSSSRDEKSMSSDVIEQMQENNGASIIAKSVVRYHFVVAIKPNADKPGDKTFIDHLHNLTLLLMQEVAGLTIKFSNPKFFEFQSRLGLNNSPQFINGVESHFVFAYEFSFGYGKILNTWFYDNFNEYPFEITQNNVKTSKGEEIIFGN